MSRPAGFRLSLWICSISLSCLGTTTAAAAGCPQLQWSRTMGGIPAAADAWGSVGVDSLGNILVAGFTSDPPFGFAHPVLRKYDPNGIELWTNIDPVVRTQSEIAIDA